MSRLEEIARNVAGDGGEYISINDIIANYPEGVTVNGAAIRNSQKINDVPCLTFSEDSTKYFYAVSGDLSKIYNAWKAACNESIDDLNNELANEHIKIKLWKIKTKSGNTYLKACVVGTVSNPVFEQVDAETGEILID